MWTEQKHPIFESSHGFRDGKANSCFQTEVALRREGDRFKNESLLKLRDPISFAVTHDKCQIPTNDWHGKVGHSTAVGRRQKCEKNVEVCCT